MLATVPTELITTGTRLRDVSEAQVETLVNSIADIGLLNPLTVYRRKVISNGLSVDGYGLVAGAHRLEAINRLGLAEVDVQIVDLGDLERQIAECDENLCGSVLTPSERALFTRRRKEAYEALHPAAKHGGDRKSDQVANSATCSYADDQAAKTGQSARTVRQDAERGEKVSNAALALVKGTRLDTGVYLDRLKSLPQEEQPQKVREDLAADRPKPRLVDGPDDVRERQVVALMNAWNKAGEDARREFLDAIDNPVMGERWA